MLLFVLSYLLFIGEFVYREFFLRKKGPAKHIHAGQFDKGSTLFAGMFILVGFLLPLLFSFFHYGIPIQNLFIRWTGIILMLLGTIIQIIAVRTLGKFYARTLVIQTNHTIIHHGIYHFIRHPGYLGGILVWEGFGLGTNNWIAFLLLTLLTLAYYAYRIRLEEAMLLYTFGDAYREYTKRSYLLLPFLY